MRFWLSPGSMVAIFIFGCTPDEGSPNPIQPPDIESVLVYESDQVQVFVEPTIQFCQGDGARMDAHVKRVAAQLETDTPPKVPVYVVENDKGTLIADWCFGSAETLGGCFQPWIVMAKAWAVPHEL